jgi:hypothetical protein
MALYIHCDPSEWHDGVTAMSLSLPIIKPSCKQADQTHFSFLSGGSNLVSGRTRDSCVGLETIVSKLTAAGVGACQRPAAELAVLWRVVADRVEAAAFVGLRREPFRSSFRTSNRSSLSGNERAVVASSRVSR